MLPHVQGHSRDAPERVRTRRADGVSSPSAMEIVTADQMRRIDRHAIRTLGIPSRDLMERAGLRVAEAADARLREAASGHVSVLCGKGNNGGDGLVAARYLAGGGWSVRVLLAADPATLTGDAAANLAAAREAEVPITVASTPAAWRSARAWVAESVLVVDALLGTGLTGPARGLTAAIIDDVARMKVPVVAVDLPSGLSGDAIEVAGPVLPAAISV